MYRTMAQVWQAYDAAAGVHDRVAGPSIFEPPARDLVERVGVAAGAAVLDVGTGSGVAARAVLQGVPGARVTGLDPSVEMLRVARARGIGCVVAGALPGLPFAGGSFDCILANFVLSHVRDYAGALSDMVRVLRPGGRLGVTAWTGAENEYRQAWQSVADRFVDKQKLKAAMLAALPWEDWLMEPDHLRQALREAGLRGVELERRSYRAPMRIAEFLEMRETAMQGRYIRQSLDERRWEEFRQALAVEFYGRFRDPIEHARDVHIGVGRKA